MAAAAPPSFVTRIRAHLHSLSVSERRLAEVVLEFPGDVASYSASELAKLANVSNATVTRFVRHLGYDNYEAARRHARAERNAGSPLFLTSPPTSKLNSLESHLLQGQTDLDSTFRRISEADIRAIAEAILGARRVWMLGFRASHAFAAYLRWQILQVVEGAVVIPSGGETLAEHLVSMTGEDVVVAFALRRRVAAMPHALGHAVKAGAKVICITNNQPGPRLPATQTIVCDTNAPGPLDNHVAVIAFCHLLATRIIELSGAAGRRRLRAIETVHDQLAELQETDE